MATSFMNLTLPTVGVTIGDTWATQLNTALTSLDSHDHSTGKGQKIPTAGLNINADLTFNNKGLTNLNYSNFKNNTGSISTLNSLYVKSGELYYRDALNNEIQMTSVGGISFPDGTVTAPGMHFSSDTDTGFYRSTTDEISVATNGTQIFIFGATGDLTASAGATLFVDTIEDVAGTGVVTFTHGLTSSDTINGTDISLSGNLDKASAATLTIGATNASQVEIANSGATTVIKGDLQVDGTTTTVNSTTLDVTDANITVNNGGNQVAADGISGLTIEM